MVKPREANSTLKMGLENAQGLYHFLTQSPWEAQAFKSQRLELILKFIKGRKIVLIIDETGDPKKGKATDYVARQYLGRPSAATISLGDRLLSRSFEHILLQILTPGISWASCTQRLSAANFPPKGRSKSSAGLGACSTFRYMIAKGDARVLSDFSSFSGT